MIRNIIISLLFAALILMHIIEDENGVAGTPTPLIEPTVIAPAGTITPVYFQSNADQIPQFVELSTMADCDFPCFWGLQPDVSTEQDVFTVIKDAGFLNNIEDGYQLDNPGDDQIITQSVVFNFNNNLSSMTSTGFTIDHQVLKTINGFITKPYEWLPVEQDFLSFPAILKKIKGTPEIYFFTQGNFRANNAKMYVLFSENMALFSYSFDFMEEQSTPIDRNAFKVCPGLKQIRYMRFWVQRAGATESTTHFTPITLGDKDTPSIENVFNINAKDFIDFFRDHPNECLTLEVL